MGTPETICGEQGGELAAGDRPRSDGRSDDTDGESDFSLESDI